MFYAYVNIADNQILGTGECPRIDEATISIAISEEAYNNIDCYIYDEGRIILDPDYEQKQSQKERERLDNLYLTPADVERALYKAKGMDFEDLKALIAEKAPQLDIKALAIEFRANNFYRGATVNGMRLIDTVGALLGYPPDAMDYLFIHKELPAPDNEGV